ncbi:hypothetical protein [Nocardia anaemiae]|uniref:hypothetical protein n=1 Tax=Nocardia anaemiae TaxID=263910 RepID=UPI0007A4948A|nr:hypothetical protein [Nocardia anaemiae]
MTTPQQYERQYQANLGKAQQDLARFLKEDGNSVFDKAIWNDKPKLTGSDVNKLLDQAAPGLEWFQLALVRYHRVWDLLKLPGFDSIVVEPLSLDGTAVGGERIDTIKDPNEEMRRLEWTYYDQQRSMNLDSLRSLSAALAAACSGTDSHPSTADITTDLAGIKDAVPEVWQGNAGGAAQDYLAGLHAHADQQTQYVQAVTAAVNGLPDVLLQIVRDKANFVAGFDSSQCPVAGHAMRLDGAEDPVSAIITVASGDRDWLGNDTQTAIRQLHITESDGSVMLNSAGNMSKIQPVCKQWLTDHFGPAVREAFKAFVHQCALADYYIRRAYQPVMDLLDNHDPKPFPKPQDQQTPAQSPTSQTGAASTGVQTAGVNSPTSETAPQSTSTIPTSATPTTSQTNPLQTLTSLASQAGQTVQQGLSQLGTTVQQGLSGLGGITTGTGSTIAGTSESSGSKTLASFTVAGQSMTVTQAPDGTVTAKITGPDGKSQQYSMGIKDGVPFFTPTAESATTPTTTNTSNDSAPPTLGSTAGSGATTRVEAPTATLSVPVTQSGTSVEQTSHTATTDSTSGSSASGSQATTGSTTSGMPGSSAAGGKNAAERDRSSTGLVLPQPMWNASPGFDGVFDAPSGPDGATALGPVLATAGPLDSGSQVASDAEAPTDPAPLPEPATTPVSRDDGVKIEIDMGEPK